MKYRRQDAKDYARAHMKGIWAAALVPFAEDLSIDEAGFRRNLRHWVDDLGIDGDFHRRQAERVLLDVGCRAQALVRDHRRRDRQDRAGTIASCSDQNMDVVDRACQARPGGRRAIHRGACAGAALPAQAGRDALPVLQGDQRAGGHRHRDVEPPGLRLSDEPGAVRADRRAAEHRGDQIQRAARNVRAADAACRRQADRQHGVGGGVVRQHRRARLAALSVLVAALPVPDQGRPPHARIHRSGVQGRRGQGQGRARQPQSGARGVPPLAPGREAAGAFQILAGAARPGRRAGAAADAGIDAMPRRRRRAARSRPAGCASTAQAKSSAA